VNKGGKWIPLQAHCFSVLVDAIRINQQEAIHDTITRAKPQQKRSHCIAKGVRKHYQELFNTVSLKKEAHA